MATRKAQQTIDNVVNFNPEITTTTHQLAAPTSISALPDLSTAIEEPIELGYQYWTPVNIGEYKRGVVINIECWRRLKTDHLERLVPIEY